MVKSVSPREINNSSAQRNILPTIAVTDFCTDNQETNVLKSQDDYERWNDSAGNDNVNIKSPINTAHQSHREKPHNKLSLKLGQNMSHMRNLHHKRRQPELYLSKNLNEIGSEPQNNFNKILKSSLLSPSKRRDVNTFREQQQIQSLTRSILANHKREERLKAIEQRQMENMFKSMDNGEARKAHKRHSSCVTDHIQTIEEKKNVLPSINRLDQDSQTKGSETQRFDNREQNLTTTISNDRLRTDDSILSPSIQQYQNLNVKMNRNMNEDQFHTVDHAINYVNQQRRISQEIHEKQPYSRNRRAANYSMTDESPTIKSKGTTNPILKSHLRNNFANNEFNVFLTQNRDSLSKRSNAVRSMASIDSSPSVLPQLQKGQTKNELIIKDIIRKVQDIKG